MAERVISEHSLSPSLGRGRRFASGVLEGALLSLFSLFLFVLAGYLDNVLPFYREHSTSCSAYQSQMVSLICESGAGESDGSGALLSYSERAENYLKDASYTSLLKHGETPSNLLYDGAKELRADNDLPFYYLVRWKTEKAADFANPEEKGISLYWEWFAGARVYFDDDESHPALLLENANAISEYFRNPSYEKGAEISAKLEESYRNLCKNVVNDFQSNCLSYQKVFLLFGEERDAIYRFKIAEAFLCHLLGSLVYFFAFPFCFKGKTTLGMRILKIWVIRRDGTLLAWWERLLRALLLTVETLLIPSLAPLLFYGSSGVDLFLRPLLGPFSLLWACLLSFVLLLFSYSGCFYLKDKASWSEFVFKGRGVDGREG